MADVKRSGWNRSSDDESKVRAGGAGSNRLLVRGAVAGLLVVVLAGTAMWFVSTPAGREATADDEASSSRKLTDAADRPKASQPKGSAPTSVHKSELPLPKISSRKIAKRAAIPAPPPLEEMKETMTNKPPKKKVPFRTGAEQLLALAMPSTPGAPVPPLPEITDEGVAEDLKKAMDNVLKAEEGDSQEILDKKISVAMAKEEFRELRQTEGYTFTEYLNALRDQANSDAAFLAEAHKISNDLYHDETISDEDYISYRDQINVKLRARGLPEIE